ncbi:hypothetical protein [Endozoicomonas sp. ALB032]|uniref:hypothetical protein n=1 Tax=Endozoicomonas sp. ALB032 TaxID=3403082 RepID=UPI003BB73B35
MFKKLLAASLMTVTMAANSTSISPISYGFSKDVEAGSDRYIEMMMEAISSSPVRTVPITAGNLNNSAGEFEILVDGEVIKRIHLESKQTRLIQVPVQIDKPNSPQSFNICVLSADSGTMLRAQVCMKAVLAWVQ